MESTSVTNYCIQMCEGGPLPEHPPGAWSPGAGDQFQMTRVRVQVLDPGPHRPGALVPCSVRFFSELIVIRPIRLTVRIVGHAFSLDEHLHRWMFERGPPASDATRLFFRNAKYQRFDDKENWVELFHNDMESTYHLATRTEYRDEFHVRLPSVCPDSHVGNFRRCVIYTVEAELKCIRPDLKTFRLQDEDMQRWVRVYDRDVVVVRNVCPVKTLAPKCLPGASSVAARSPLPFAPSPVQAKIRLTSNVTSLGDVIVAYVTVVNPGPFAVKATLALGQVFEDAPPENKFAGFLGKRRLKKQTVEKSLGRDIKESGAFEVIGETQTMEVAAGGSIGVGEKENKGKQPRQGLAGKDGGRLFRVQVPMQGLTSASFRGCNFSPRFHVQLEAEWSVLGLRRRIKCRVEVYVASQRTAFDDADEGEGHNVAGAVASRLPDVQARHGEEDQNNNIRKNIDNNNNTKGTNYNKDNRTSITDRDREGDIAVAPVKLNVKGAHVESLSSSETNDINNNECKDGITRTGGSELVIRAEVHEVSLGMSHADKVTDPNEDEEIITNDVKYDAEANTLNDIAKDVKDLSDLVSNDVSKRDDVVDVNDATEKAAEGFCADVSDVTGHPTVTAIHDVEGGGDGDMTVDDDDGCQYDAFGTVMSRVADDSGICDETKWSARAFAASTPVHKALPILSVKYERGPTVAISTKKKFISERL